MRIARKARSRRRHARRTRHRRRARSIRRTDKRGSVRKAAALASPANLPKSCADNPDPLAVARVVTIDTSHGATFGGVQYKDTGLLKDKEVVLTFDDGPMPSRTLPILKALEAECTTAVFFSVGRMAAEYPHIIRQALALGHTVGTHTWSHANLRRLSKAGAARQIERGFAAVAAAARQPIAPFFRFPYLAAPKVMETYLRGRKIGIFSIDIDSRDWRGYSPAHMVRWIMARLKERGKAILLFHDIKPNTARMVPYLLRALKTGGYRVVHLVPKTTYRPPEADRAFAARFMARRHGGRASPAGEARASEGESAARARRASVTKARRHRKHRRARHSRQRAELERPVWNGPEISSN